MPSRPTSRQERETQLGQERKQQAFWRNAVYAYIHFWGPIAIGMTADAGPLDIFPVGDGKALVRIKGHKRTWKQKLKAAIQTLRSD
jgi:hypothetical protein